MQEGYAANKVDHPGAVKILDDDVDPETDSCFLVMELLKGETLAERLDRKYKLPPAEVLIVAHRVLDVLVAAHANGIIHRDIKPANVFLCEDGMVKVLDFGFARVREQAFQAATTRDGVSSAPRLTWRPSKPEPRATKSTREATSGRWVRRCSRRCRVVRCTTGGR